MAERTPPHPESLVVGILLTALTALGQMATSLYVPSLPSLAQSLGTTGDKVALTLSLFLVGFAVSQLVYGPLSDRYGRRPVLMGGLALFMVASLACAVADTIETLIAARFVQAVGACSGQVIARAVVRDVYGPDRAARVLAYIGAALAVSPAVMPIIGGYLQVWFGWRANFLFLSAVAILVFQSTRVLLAETNPEPDPGAVHPRGMARTYASLLRSRTYLGYTLAVAFVFAGLMAFTAASPFIFIDVMGMRPDRYGMLAVFNVMGFLAGTLVGGRLTLTLGIRRMVLVGVGLAVLGGGTMTGVALAGHLSIAGIIAPMSIFLAGMGLVLPNGMAGAMGPYPQSAGAASALLGFLQMSIAALASQMAGWLSHASPLPMAILILALGVGAAVSFLVLVPETEH